MLEYLIVTALFLLSINKVECIALFKNPARQTGVFACAVIFAALWQIKAGILPYLDIHILGVTAVTLVMGWRLACLSALVGACLLLYFTSLSVNDFAHFLLFTALLPIYLSYALFVLCYNFLPRHFFVYIFVCAFICAGLVAATKILVTSSYFWSQDIYPWQTLCDNYLFFSVLMWFPEAMLNGMAITLLITYRPEWVKTFYDQEYLDK
ncbi:energy-coupling factor ABC transporter permease [Pseudoalteromonas sp. MMG005]|uniref:energy-coupling factor ABC transporter permease n=1 Tax=Pseudoalteromonas sp. MMG005 TaxID=2822682 RepID=UPI001B39FA44|nr:energy-coupling factor ABC transporter permease [Pseudoalteromonas sp. MMG005]MBQ4845024.1 energy-coupling factor ABC transporter permease [Pseudoalteromonas sp. MMG005]